MTDDPPFDNEPVEDGPVKYRKALDPLHTIISSWTESSSETFAKARLKAKAEGKAEGKAAAPRETGALGGRPPADWHDRALKRELAVKANYPGRSQDGIEKLILQKQNWGEEPPRRPSPARLKLFLRASKK
jgi:hypothetical protein